MTTVAVYGLGYIGLPTSLEFAKAGYTVVGIDVNAEVCEKLSKGQVHLHEEGLQELYQTVLDKGLFTARTEPITADIHLIAVPTPINDDKTADLKYVISASESIATVVKAGDAVVLISTSPPRTCLDVIAPIIEKKTGLSHFSDYDLAHCPERVLPGRILIELVENDRIVGGTTEQATQRIAEMYRAFVKGKIHTTDSVTAEMVKLMENTFRDVNIALANEINSICEVVGINSREAIKLANHHPRVNIHQPGIGVGGHCIPIDPWFLIEAAPDVTPLLKTARKINDSRPHQVTDRVLEFLNSKEDAKLAIFGLAFKPNVDDMRESPAIEVAELVAKSLPNAEILVVEPFTSSIPRALNGFSNLKLVSQEEALSEANVAVCLVPHDQFKALRGNFPAGMDTLDFNGIW